MGKTFSCRMLSAKLTEEEGAIKPFYIDLRDTRTFITDKNIVRQPHLEEIIQSVLRRQERIILTFESPRCTVLGNTRINSVKNC
jgi:hypothetical protein